MHLPMIDNVEYNRKLSQAISRQGRSLFTRQESETHKAYIRNAAKLNNDDVEFSNLLRSVFSHHDVNNFASIDFDDVDIAVQDNVSRYFHNQNSYYHRPEIIQGQLSSNPTLDYKEFLDRVLDARSTRSRNRVSFLIGGVGIGKTTFLCNFLCRSYDVLKERNVLPIKINLDVTTNHKVPTTKTIIELIKTSVMNALQMSNYLTDTEHLQLAMDCAIIEESAVVEESDEATAESNLAHTINLIKSRHNISIFIVLDNIDYLYHLGDRGFFAEDGDDHPDRKEVREAHSAIINIVKLFWINADRVTANLGMSILIPCRNDTITFLEAGHHEVPLDELEDSLFTLQEPTLAVARSVIQKRFELLDELAEKISESAKKKEFKTQAIRLQESYERRGRLGEVLLTDLWKLSRKGLRDMIDQIRQFSYLEYFDSKRVNLNSRFTQQYYPSMLAYMLKGKRRYSQFSGNVPNIYLINAPAPSNEMGVPEEFKEPHLYTLWLKHLILEFLLSRKSVTTTPEEVIRVFSGANKRGYPENLVRYVLSSLFAVPTAELIEVNVAADGAGGSGSYIM